MIKDSKGQALTEVLIAAIVLGVSIVAVSSFVISQSQIDSNVQGLSACRGYVQSVLNDFSDTSSSNIINYIPTAVGATRSPPLVAPRVEQDYYATSVPAYYFRRTFQNIENAMTRAYQIYMGDTGYCSGFKALTAGVLSNPNILTAITNAKYSAKIRFEPFNMNTNQPIATAACDTPPDIRPMAGANGGNTYAVGKPPNPNNFGIKISVTVTGTNGKECTGYKVITYAADNVPNSQPTPAIVDAPWPTYPSSCVTGDYYGVMASSEPGSIFVCRWIQPANYTSLDCQGFGGTTGSPPPTASVTVTNPGPGSSDTKTILRLAGVPTMGANLYINTLDTANNIGPFSPAAYIRCPCDVVDTCSGGQAITEQINCIGPPDTTWTPTQYLLNPTTRVKAWYKNRTGTCSCYPESVQYSSTPATDTYANCAVATRSCSTDGTTVSAWTCNGCAAGFHLSGSACVADPCIPFTSQACVGADPNANYTQTCTAAATWGACTCTGCRNGFGGYAGTCGSCALAPGAWRCNVASAPAVTPNNWCDLSKTGLACSTLGAVTASGGGVYANSTWPVVRNGIDLVCDTTANCLANPDMCKPR